MSLYERIDFPGVPASQANGRDWLCYKFPGEEFNTRSVLTVGPGQVAIAVHAGKIENVFKSGTFTLTTDNIPFIKNIVKKFYKNAVPYKMEIYFLNDTALKEMKWGTAKPIRIESPNEVDLGLVFGVRLNGSLYLKLKHYQFFLDKIAGNLPHGALLWFDEIEDKFLPIIQENITTEFRSLIKEQKLSFVEVQDVGTQLSRKITEIIHPEIEKYGFDVTDFKVASISIPEEDWEKYNEQNFEARRGAKHGQLSDAAYARGAQMRALDALNNASNNEGNVGGLMGAGVGLGMGLGMMGPVNTMANQTATGQNTQEQKVLIICPKCGAKVDANSKFCPECGQSLGPKKCSKCGAEIKDNNAKFCPECGEKL